MEPVEGIVFHILYDVMPAFPLRLGPPLTRSYPIEDFISQTRLTKIPAHLLNVQKHSGTSRLTKIPTHPLNVQMHSGTSRLTNQPTF